MDLVKILNILEGYDETDTDLEETNCTNDIESNPKRNNTISPERDFIDSYVYLDLDKQHDLNPTCSSSLEKHFETPQQDVYPTCSSSLEKHLETPQQIYKEPVCSSSKNNTIENNFFFIESKKGGKILMKDGYRYRINRKNKCGSSIWNCVAKYCKASITLDEKEIDILRTTTNHACSPDYKREEYEKILNQCKKDVQTNLKPIPALYEEAVRDLKNDNYVDHVRKFQSVKSTLYRSRNNYLKVKKTTFKNLEDVEISPEIGHNFLIADNGEKDKILIFMLKEFKEELKHLKDFFVDGTFYSASPPFYQLYSVHADIGSTRDKTVIVPIIFALLPNKTQSTYLKMFELIKENIPEFHPKKIKIDFELAAINAMREIFPEAHISGCFFHFNKALWKKGKDVGLTQTTNGKNHIAMCAATAHLPVEYIPAAWESLLDNTPSGEDARLFNEYVTSQWMNNNIRLFCCYNERHRTTNPVEGWHNRLNKKLNKKPPLYTLISVLKEEAKESKFRIEQTGTYDEDQKPRKKSSLAIDNRISKIVEDFTTKKIEVTKCLKRLSVVKF